jgi:hypothetical protein
MKLGSGWRRARPSAATLRLALSLMSILALCRVLPAVGQDVDHAAVLELGAAVARETKGPSPWQGGGTVAVEFTPIEEWLEIEIGASALWRHSGSELSADFLLKKPYRLSSTAEFMIGLGPEVARDTGSGTHLGVEGVLDFMFWPRNNIGWYLEAGYGPRGDRVRRGDPQSLRGALGLTMSLRCLHFGSAASQCIHECPDHHP